MKIDRDEAVLAAMRCGRWLHRRHHDELRQQFPDLTQRDLLMLTYLLKRRGTDDVGDGIPCGCQDVANYFSAMRAIHKGSADRPLVTPGGYYPVRTMLEELKAAVPGMEIGWREYGADIHRARLVTSLVLPAELTAILYRDSDDPLLRNGLIDVATGHIIGEKDRRRYFNERYDWVSLYNESARYAWQKPFLAYLNDLPPQLYHIDDEVMATARNAVLTGDYSPMSRRVAWNALDAIALWPKPLYQWTLNSARCFADGYALPNVKSELRRILLAGDVEVDLANCHLAILARDFHVPILQELRERGESAWDYCLRELGEAPDDPIWRAAVKTGAYSLCNGAGIENLFGGEFTSWSWRTAHGLLDGGEWNEWRIEQARRFAQIPMIAEIIRERKRWYRKMERNVLRGPYGMRYELGGEDGNQLYANRAYAQYLQETEQWLMAPVRQLAMESVDTRHAVWITAYQHDGATLRFARKDEQESKLGRLQEAVRAHAAEVGIRTSLEVKH